MVIQYHEKHVMARFEGEEMWEEGKQTFESEF